MSDNNVLENLGLTPNESKVYQYLLSKQSVQSASDIITALSLDKVSTYRALKSLEQQNLLNVSGEKRTQRYQISTTQNLYKKYEEKVQGLTSLRSQLDQLITNATSQQYDFYLNNKIKIYKGLSGYKQWMHERLKNTSSIQEFGDSGLLKEMFDDVKEMDEYILSYINKRVEQKISVQSLLSRPKQLMRFDKTNKKLLKEQKIIPALDEFSGFMSVFGDSFGFYTKQGGEYLGVILNDPLLAGMMKVLFNTLWIQGETI